MNYSNQLYIMNTALLEIAVALNLDCDDLCIKYNEIKKEWRIVHKPTMKIKFKKIF